LGTLARIAGTSAWAVVSLLMVVAASDGTKGDVFELYVTGSLVVVAFQRERAT